MAHPPSCAILNLPPGLTKVHCCSFQMQMKDHLPHGKIPVTHRQYKAPSKFPERQCRTDAVLSTSTNLEEAIEVLSQEAQNVVIKCGPLRRSAKCVKRYQEESSMLMMAGSNPHIKRKSVRDALTFYKCNMGDKQKLLRKLSVR
eukprot:Seg944.5 transcript_id=Seg944.5/GoldUCD/mRNA.D3Y31 product="hypothetical protein" protein_id=Seg944.5/GoldUCD/D3Y31